MSKTAEAVSTFLAELAKKLETLGNSDLAVMLAMKEEEVYDAVNFLKSTSLNCFLEPLI